MRCELAVLASQKCGKKKVAVGTTEKRVLPVLVCPACDGPVPNLNATA